MSEWTLIVFTLAIQLAGGLALAVTLSDRTAGPAKEFLRPLGIVIFPLAAFGLLVSLLHLGRPLSAWKSLLHLGSSRLSLEVLLTSLFVGAAFLYSYTWWAQRPESRFTLGLVTSVLAAGSVASSAAIYLVPTQPVWNSAWVPLSFFGTTLLLGGCATIAFADPPATRDWLGYSLAGTVIGSLLLILAAWWMISILHHGSPDEFAAARLRAALQLLTAQYPGWFGLHIFLAGIVPLACAAILWHDGSLSTPSPWIRWPLFLAVSSGAVIGRTLMYLVATTRPQF
jgi:anaerobic dimethyl sulfoxide reductase subunit C (anchor subunit)